MPTIIALDVSLSMTRPVLNNDEERLTYHQLAVLGIHKFLEHLSNSSKLEFVSLISYSMDPEVIVDFTRDYDSIRHALKQIEHCDKTSLEYMLQKASNALASVWGTQNYCQILVFTDCGIGFGNTSLKKLISNLQGSKNQELDYSWLTYLKGTKLSFIALGSSSDSYFKEAIKIYEQFLDVSRQNGHVFLPKDLNDEGKSSETSVYNGSGGEQLSKAMMIELIERVCETNYKQFEAMLKCGGYFKLECPILIWPQPMPYKTKDLLNRDTVMMISRRLEVCGFLSLADIGSPVSISRHLIVPKMDSEKTSNKKGAGSEKTPTKSLRALETPANEYEKLECDIRAFYSKSDGNTSDDEENRSHGHNDANKESMCVLLHGALKVENMAALVLLNNNWFGFIYSYADSKKKSNLMLNVLPPGNNVVPWLGDLRLLGTIDDAIQGENPLFPVKSEKRSYSQNCVVWIKQAGLQSDIQKVLRHAKKLPEKTPHFYKELNRIRRAALSLGFIELLEGLANIFEREISVLPQNASPDCAIQLKHAATELRKIANRDLKTLIIAQPTKYNQL